MHPDPNTAGLPPDALAGAVAVVTGAGMGIGRAVAERFARLGARVVIADVAGDAGREVERAIRFVGGEALFVHTDVSDQEQVAALAERTRRAFGHASILINNAIVCPVAPVAEMEPALWDRVMAVNLRGTFLTCRAFLPGMQELGHGTIVNMISTDAMPFLSAYIASKQGIAGFSQSLAAEVGPHNVRVIAFAPGMVSTPGLRAAARDLAPRLDLTPEEFLGMAMDAEQAGLATAHLVTRLAGEYHGEQVDGYVVLERAGLASAPVPAPETGPPGGARAPVERSETLERAVPLGEQLQEVLLETEAEFKELPIFVRPLAQRGFKNKVGQRVEAARRMAAELTGQVRGMAGGEAAAEVAFHAAYPRLIGLLQGLERYFREAPGESARFSRDEDFLAHVTRVMAKRQAVVVALMEVVAQLERTNDR